MSELSPYRPPESNATAGDDSGFIAGGRAVDAGRGWEWIAEGFGLFKKQPGIWILLIVVYLLIAVVLGVVPLIGSVANMLLYPVFGAGLLLGCRALEQGESLEIAHLFAGFKDNTSNLVVLGLLALVGTIVVLIPMIVIVGGGAFLAVLRGDTAGIATLGLSFALGFLVVLALSIPLYMALWFAPALIVFRNLAPVEAMKTSFCACLRNIIPFLLYGIILLVLGVLAMIPFGLGLLILVPVIVASVYVAYRDIFFRR